MNTRHPHILNASSNLLGICFVIITGLKLTGSNPQSWADEIAWIAAGLFLTSIVLAYLGVRNEDRLVWQATWAERSFLAGVAGLTLSVLVGAVFLNPDASYPLASRQPSMTQASPTSPPATTSLK